MYLLSNLGAGRPLYPHEKAHTVAAEAAAPVAAPAADPWIYGSISFILGTIFFCMK